MTDITPIETKYNGYKFRSRLEARWAVFFDSLGIEYEYEKEGYNLDGIGPYLPDFFLPDVHGGMWVEIKPDEAGKDAYKKMDALILLTKKCGTVLNGDPMKGYLQAVNNDGDSWTFNVYHKYDYDETHKDIETVGEDFPYIFCICPWCGKAGFEFDGRGARICGYKTHCEDEESASNIAKWQCNAGYHHMDKCYTGDHQRILSACNKARSARF